MNKDARDVATGQLLRTIIDDRAHNDAVPIEAVVTKNALARKREERAVIAWMVGKTCVVALSGGVMQLQRTRRIDDPILARELREASIELIDLYE